MIVANKRAGRLFLIALLSLVAVLLAGCGAGSKYAADMNGASPQRGENNYESGGESLYSQTGEYDVEEKAALQTRQRYVIRTASLTLTVPNTREMAGEIEQMALSEGGIVSESNIYESREGQYAADLTLRIPEHSFDLFINRLQDLGTTDNVRKSSEDVTLPYLDLETRIKNLKSEEGRLREILAKADSVEEILQVERELSRVRGEIELNSMSFTHLQEQVSLSTIEIYIREEVIDTGAISQKPFANMGKRLKAALFRSVNFISSAAAFTLVALTTLLPVLIIIGLLLLLIMRIVKSLRKRNTAVPPGGPLPKED